VDDLPPFTDYAMKGRTYRYFTGEPLYPFGYGLSYTTFAYRNLRRPKKIAPDQPIVISAEVENTGAVAGEEVAQLYISTPGAQWPSPLRSLVGFQRIKLQPHERRTVQFHLNAKQVPLAPSTFSVGGKQPGFTGPADASTTSVVSDDGGMTR
jgi:beta-glucosidase